SAHRQRHHGRRWGVSRLSNRAEGSLAFVGVEGLSMEHWIIHYDANYDAVPWPFAKTWEEFVNSPEPLVHPCDDFGRPAICDSLGETPTVPPRLPRLMPRGKYRMALYHD